MSLSAKDGTGNLVSLKTSLDTSEHVTHHNIDNVVDVAKGVTAAVTGQIASAGTQTSVMDLGAVYEKVVINSQDVDGVDTYNLIFGLGIASSSKLGELSNASGVITHAISTTTYAGLHIVLECPVRYVQITSSTAATAAVDFEIFGVGLLQ